MEITKMDIKDLKALAYDLILDSQRISGNLQAVNKQIEVLLAMPESIPAVKEEEIL